MKINTLFYVLVHQCLSSIIKVHYKQAYYSDLLLVKSQHQREALKIEIDLTLNYTWLNINSKQTLFPKQIIEFDENYIASHSKKADDVIVFTEARTATEVRLPLDIINDTISFARRGHMGALGLGFHFINSSYSVIHQLKHQGFINYLSFSICNPFDLFLGGIPQSTTQNRAESYCNIIDRTSAAWNCKMSTVQLSNKNKSISYHSHHSLVFFTTENHLNYVPKQFFDLMVNVYFKEQIERRGVLVVVDAKGNRRIHSMNIKEIFVGEIAFVIGAYSYQMRIGNFWTCTDLSCELDLWENAGGDEWALGSHFLRLFNTLFDYEAQRVTFYSLGEVVKVRYVRKVLFLIMSCNSGVLLFGIGVRIGYSLSDKRIK